MTQEIILVTGASGFVGRSLISSLQSNGNFLVRAAYRRIEEVLPAELDMVEVGDLSHNNNWQKALTNIKIVIHTAARVHVMNDTADDPLTEFRRVNVDGTINLAKQAAAAGVRRFIFLSSIKVNGESTQLGHPFSADDSTTPIDPYGISKAQTEKALLDLSTKTGMEVVIIRPVLVYGPEVKANFLSMMRWLSRGVPLPLGSINNKRSLVALDNLVDLIITCINHPAAANQIFLVSDGEDLSTTELLQRIGLSLGRPARLFTVPVWIINVLAKLLGKHDVTQRLIGSLQVDITKTRDLLNWEPPVNVEEAFQKTVSAFLHQKRF